jgi:ketosteroid isomerase-like protein
MVFAIGLVAGRLTAQVVPKVADSSFRAFLREFDAGLTAMVNGDPTQWLANASQADDVTLMTPYGVNVRGWAAVGKQYEMAARRFAPGSTVSQEYVAAQGMGDLGYTVVLQRGMYRGPDSDTTRQGFTRATNIFIRENGSWKLVHRHMDHLTPGSPGPSPGAAVSAATTPETSPRILPPAQGVPPIPDSSFRAFLTSFESGQVQMLNGDASLWVANASHADDVTLLSPYGIVARGWDAVSKLYLAAAGHFVSSGATVQREYMAVEVHGDLAYEVVREYANPRGAEGSLAGATRATHVFRREAGAWKLVHRHMDHLNEGG